jgi:CRISPR-associated protein Csd1
MILQELCKYYDRLEADENSGVAPLGKVVQGIAFAVVLDDDGNLIDIQDMRDSTDGKPRNRPMNLPGKAKQIGRASCRERV